MGKIGLITPEPDFGGQKLCVSKPNSRTRPGTATGLRPGLVSPKLGSGLGEHDPTAPPDGMESTWPRRVIVRKRTILQGGALHNLPILPPLPAVLSALEKRFPNHFPRLAHHSENPLINPALIGAMGRCSLKEPSHLELGLCASVVSRASLKEQSLEQWRATKEHNDLRIQGRSNENREESTTEKEEKKVNTIEDDQLMHKEMTGGNQGDTSAMHEKSEKNKCEESYGVAKVEDVITKQVESREIAQVEIQQSVIQEIQIKDVLALEVKVDERTSKTVPSQEQPHPKEEEIVGKTEVRIDFEGEWMEGRDLGEEDGEVESWDVVLDMVNTIWEDGWAGGRGAGAAEEGDTASISGSLQRWPLLRPPAGFGGSHPPSSAASELSLTELVKRARELDSDLEHLDLSQPHREAHGLMPKPQKERTDMYQTHPGPQREKCALLKGVGSRSQVCLELTPAIIEKVNADVDTNWSAKSAAGAATVGTSSTKEDSSPDSNRTLESDSSGIFLSLSNQSQEEVGSDSDQPMSGSDLGSSSTSFDRDGEEAGVKEWGREESAELDCPSTQAHAAQAHEPFPAISNKPSSFPQAQVDPFPAQKDVVTVTHLAPQCPEEGDFLSTDSFVYLAAPACLLLGPEGTGPYGTRDSDSDSSGSVGADMSVLGCGSLAGDSDWDSDASDSDPHRSSSRGPGAGGRPPPHTTCPPAPTEPGFDLFGDVPEPEVLSELFEEEDAGGGGVNVNNNVTTVPVPAPATSTVIWTPGGVRGVTPEPPREMTRAMTTAEQPSTAKKVTWQFRPAQRSVCTGSRKEKESPRSLSLGWLPLRLALRLGLRLALRLDLRLGLRLALRLALRLPLRLALRLGLRLDLRLGLRLALRLALRPPLRL
ncbi:hypothetical protein NHX12_019319, partial [Muraenolepis orangiensis]